MAKKFSELGFEILATGGTFRHFESKGVKAQMVFKISEGRPNIEDSIRNGEIALAINTSGHKSKKGDAAAIRQAVLKAGVPYFTNMRTAMISANAIASIESAKEVKSLQEYLG